MKASGRFVQLGALWRSFMPSLCVVSSSLHRCPSHEDRSDMYHLSFPKDTWTPKLLVYGTYILETAQTIIVTYDIFNTYARHFGDLAALDQLQNEWIAIPFMTSISTTSPSTHLSTPLLTIRLIQSAQRCSFTMLTVLVFYPSQNCCGLAFRWYVLVRYIRSPQL